MRLGREAAAYVSSNFPKEMELKFEKIAQPFLLLHVNRHALPTAPFSFSSVRYSPVLRCVSFFSF